MDTVKLVVEALLSVAVEVEVIDPAVNDPPVAESKNREENVAVTAFNMEEKRLVEVALVFRRSVIQALVIVPLVVEELAIYVWPDTVRLVVEALLIIA